MNYYLIFGYQLCEKNKDFPTIRVNVNGQLVDEFVCDNEQSIEVSERTIENKCNGSKYLKHRIDRIDHHKFLIPKKCRVIELDTSSWSTEGEISINVSNNKSNYNNGFMSKRSMVSLEPVFLISKDMYHDRNLLHRIFKKTFAFERQFWYHDWRKSDRQTWPGFSAYPRWYNEEAETEFNPRGGDFEIKFNIVKKHKTFILVKDGISPKGFFHVNQTFLAWYQHYTRHYFDILVERDWHSDTEKSTVQFAIIEKPHQESKSNDVISGALKQNRINTVNED